MKNSLAAAITVALAAPGLEAQTIELDQLGSRGFPIFGARSDDSTGSSVSGAGDVNGDGLADLIIGAYNADSGDSNAGTSYVVFGKTGSSFVAGFNFSDDGFRIDGGRFFGFSGWSVSGAGDVNGDGLSDVIVGEYRASVGANSFAGSSYVVFGKPDTDTVDLLSLGTGGFRIDGAAQNDTSGFAVSGAGDVNGDGLADLIVGAPGVDRTGTPRAGAAYIVFGKADNGTVDLGALGTGGFRVLGSSDRNRTGASVSGAGDVNGDGLDDVIIGEVDNQPSPTDSSCSVVFGKADAAQVDLDSLGNGGFRIFEAGLGDRAGGSVAGAGDVNGDGLADVIVGAGGANPSGRSGAGASYVVFGKGDNGSIDLGALGGEGFRIAGADPGDFSGGSVSGAGDVNGDGLADVIIGARRADPGSGEDAGSSFVVFGKSNANPVDLGNLSGAGFRINGADAEDESGGSVSTAGDVNGDGLTDVVVGAFRADSFLYDRGGAGYVVFSQSSAPTSAVYRSRARDGDAPQVAIGVSGGGGDATHPSSRAWIDFVDGNGPGNAASTITATLTRSSGGFPDASAAVSWELDTDRTSWAEAAVQFRYLESELLPEVDESALQVVFSVDGNKPFTVLENSVVNPDTNTVTALVTDLGFFYLQDADSLDLLFGDGFEGD